MEFGGRQVNAAAVHVGVVAAQAERLRADDAAIDDEGLPILEVDATGGGLNALAFELLEEGKLITTEHGFGAVVATHLRVGG